MSEARPTCVEPNIMPGARSNPETPLLGFSADGSTLQNLQVERGCMLTHHPLIV